MNDQPGTRFAHTNIVCRDWRALVDFYVSVFDCRIIPPIRKQSGDWLDRGTGLQHAQLEGAHLLLPGHGERGPTLEIYQYGHTEDQAPLPPNSRGFGHIAFEVADVAATLKTVLAAGGTRLGELTTRSVPEVGVLTFVYARDPEGNVIEIQSWT